MKMRMTVVVLLALFGLSAPAMADTYTASVQGSPYAKYIAPEEVCAHSATRLATPAQQEVAMDCLLSYARDKKGLKTIRQDKKLVRAAKLKSQAILRCQDFNHDACGKPFISTFNDTGYTKQPGRSWSVGENIAWGSGALGSPQAIMVAWLESPGHRNNIFSSKWREFGMSLKVGALEGNEDVAVWTNTFGYTR
jgi:uncharacterized protein YkwD